MRVAIVGAGMAGLTAAHRLTQAGHTTDVYERWPDVGGMASTLDAGGGVRIERYYHHLFTSDREIAALWSELGLADELEWHESSLACFAHGRLWPFTTPRDLLRFGPLPPAARLRMGAGALALQRLVRDPLRYEAVTAHDWIRSRLGERVWRELWGPIMRGKFGARAEEITMAWLHSKWALRRGEARRERLGYPRGSWEPLLRALSGRIEAGGGRILVDRPVRRIARDAEGFAIGAGAPGSWRRGLDPERFESLGEERYDAVVATVAADLFLRLCDEPLRAALGADYRRRCESVEHHAALCLLLELDRPFGSAYWTNVLDERIPFIGAIEQERLVGAERYGGRRFLYVANYLAPGEPLVDASTDDLIAAYEPGLRALAPDFSRDWIRSAWRFAEPHAQPLVTLGYRDRLPPLQTPIEGLILANQAQIYPEDRGTNYAVRLGAEAARTLLAVRTGA